MPETTVPTPLDHELDQIVQRAADAAPHWAATAPGARARALVAAADALQAAAADLIPIAMAETGLGESRLTGELTRTAVQLRLFADVVVDGGYLDVRIDEADDDFVLGARPDVRRYHVPLGPVLNFAASNFPFAFSVAGGDTAAALAAGCPVIVKAHRGHPELSRRTASVVAGALEAAGAPAGVLQLIHRQEDGVAVLQDPRIRAASFTGSVRAGRMLADIAASRPDPIPFFGELGSVNPAFVTRAALAERGEAIVDGFAQSVAGSAGQLCTKPGFLFVPAGSQVDGARVADAIADRLRQAAEHRLLNPGIGAGYLARRDAIAATEGVEIVVAGGQRVDETKQSWVTPTLALVSAQALVAGRESLLDEAFGPLSVLVEYEDETDLPALADELFEGSLTGTVQLGAGEDTPAIRALVGWIVGHVGRVLFDGWPTGVAVTPAMQHGGPWPATTNDSSTSVGTAAIGRFLRPVAYQNAPAALLPEPLRDDNPWRVPQHRAPAGESRDWGASVLSAR